VVLEQHPQCAYSGSTMDLLGTFGQALLLLAVVVLALTTLFVSLQLRKIQRETREARKGARLDIDIRAELVEDGYSEREIRDALDYLKMKQGNA
jgi:hypothetical protein